LDLAAKGYQADFFVSPVSNSLLEGVICFPLEFAVVDGDLGYPRASQEIDISGEIIELDELCDREILAEREPETRESVEEIRKQWQTASELLAAAGRLKEEMNQLWDEGSDLNGIDRLVEALAAEILERKPCERHYFGSALSAQGLVSYVDHLSLACKARYILEGPVDRVKSAVLLEVGRRALAKGYEVEFFHDGFYPENLNMIIVTSLGVAVIDAGGLSLTARPGDIILDAREWVGTKPEKVFLPVVAEKRCRLNELIDEAARSLLEAETSLKRFHKIYSQAMDFGKMELIKERVMQEI